MFKRIFEKWAGRFRPKPSPQNAKGRQELLKAFLQEFGQIVIPGSKKRLGQVAITWEQNREGKWHLITPFASPEMRQKFPFLHLRRQHHPKDVPPPNPQPNPPRQKTPKSPPTPPPIRTPQPDPAPGKMIQQESIKPPDESLKRTVVRWNRINAADNVACPFCGTVNERVHGPGTKKCFSCGKYFGAV